MRKKLNTIAAESLLLYIENELSCDGTFCTVSSGDIDFRGNYIGKLLPVNGDKDYIDGTVFQSMHNNWIFESGLKVGYSYTPPVICSGVWVSGAFYGKSDATYGHYVDYNNGRVIFKSAHAGLAEIFANYSYKEFTCAFAYPDKMLALEHSIYNRDIFAETPPLPSGRISLPALLLEFRGEKRKPFQLGGGRISQNSFSIHIIGNTESECSDMASFLEDKDECSVKIIDFLNAPYPLNNYGDYSSNYISYSGLKSAHVLYNSNITDISSIAAPGGFPRVVVSLVLEVFKT